MPKPLDPRAALEPLRAEGPAGVVVMVTAAVPIASEDALRWSIELSTSSTSGRTVFSHGGDQMYAEHPTFTDLLEVYAELLEEGRFISGDEIGSVLLDPRVRERADEVEVRRTRRSAVRGGPLRVEQRRGLARALDRRGRLRQLPDHRPIGATHTIAEVVEASRDGAVRARIAGRIARLASMGEDVRIVVDDGTGTLYVWCPAGTSPWTVVIRRRYEFEVQVPRAEGTDCAVATDIRLLD